MKKALWISPTAALVLAVNLVVACLLAACNRSPELQLIRAAADAMGGRNRVEAVIALTIEGEGSVTNLGQNVTPDGDLPVWKVTDFNRTIELTTGRMRERETRTAQFPFALSTVQRQDSGLDGNVAYNVGRDSAETRASVTAARDRRIELLHHPLTIVRAALEPAAKLSNLRNQGNETLVDITTMRGDKATLAVDSATKLPTRVISMSSNENLGDVAVETSFSDWEDVNGLKLPRRLTTKVDRWPQFDLHVTKYTLDEDTRNLAADDSVRLAKPPAPPAVKVTAQEVGKGIWWLAGSGNHFSVLFEFDDHLTLFEVPLNEARSLAVIAEARALRPGKPLTQVIVSHHHFDHSGGLRAAVAEGLTILTYRGNVEFFKELVARKHTLQPDQLARHPQPLKIVPVDDHMTLKDRSMEVQLYHVLDNPREGTLLFAYVPRGRILVQADLYDSTWLQYPWADNFLWNLKMRSLAVNEDVPVHGTVQSFAEVVKTMESKKAVQGN
jgi:Metallo-beta-lactamase superfamily